MTPSAVKHRLILDLDSTLGPLQLTIELFDRYTGERLRCRTWEAAPFDTADDALHLMLEQLVSDYGQQLTF